MDNKYYCDMIDICKIVFNIKCHCSVEHDLLIIKENRTCETEKHCDLFPAARCVKIVEGVTLIRQ